MPFAPKVFGQQERKQAAKGYEQARGSRSARGYDGLWYRVTRPRILLRDLYQCRVCGLIVTGRHAHVDHVVAKRHGGSDEDSNLQTLCEACHAAKTARGE